MSTKQDAAKLEEVKAVWATLPIYPGMQEVHGSTMSGYGKASISKSFHSDAAYEDVKRFYVGHLLPKGWTLVSEREMKGWGSDFGGQHLEFRKGDLALGIEYAGEKANYGWEYGIAVSWSGWVMKR